MLAAAVNLDALAAVAENGTDTIRVQSEGYPLYQVALSQLEPQEDEKNTTASLIRGVAAKFVEMGYQLRGLDIYVSSQVLPGSGLSSSAAFEVLLGTVLNGMFCGGTVSAQVIAADCPVCGKCIFRQAQRLNGSDGVLRGQSGGD